MKQYPPIPRVENAPDGLFDGGHLWIQEKVDGAHLRFQLRSSGVLRFGDRRQVFGRDEIPLAYRHAVRHVRDRLDREALRRAVDDVESIVFFGEAMHRRRIDYDWDRTPSFLGFDVWSERKERFLTPDAVEKIYRTLDLRPVNAFQKEVRAADLDPETYEIPASDWYDGPAEGVVFRNKTGLRAALTASDAGEGDDRVPDDAEPEEIARAYATDRRFERVVAELERAGTAATFDAVYDRALEDVVREAHGHLAGDGAADLRAFRSEIAALAREFLDARE